MLGTGGYVQGLVAFHKALATIARTVMSGPSQRHVWSTHIASMVSKQAVNKRKARMVLTTLSSGELEARCYAVTCWTRVDTWYSNTVFYDHFSIHLYWAPLV